MSLQRTASRLARKRMVARLPYPDPQWRRRLTMARYRVGVALLRPYLDRLQRHYADAGDDATLPADQRERCDYMCIAVRHVIHHDNSVGFGHSKYLEQHQAE